MFKNNYKGAVTSSDEKIITSHCICPNTIFIKNIFLKEHFFFFNNQKGTSLRWKYCTNKDNTSMKSNEETNASNLKNISQLYWHMNTKVVFKEKFKKKKKKRV